MQSECRSSVHPANPPVGNNDSKCQGTFKNSAPGCFIHSQHGILVDLFAAFWRWPAMLSHIWTRRRNLGAQLVAATGGCLRRPGRRSLMSTMIPRAGSRRPDGRKSSCWPYRCWLTWSLLDTSNCQQINALVQMSCKDGKIVLVGATTVPFIDRLREALYEINI